MTPQRLALLVCLMLSASAAATAQTLSVNGEAPPAEVSVGAATSITIAVADGPGNATDWVGLYPAGAPDSGYLSWSYLSGTASPPASGLTSASVTTYAPLAAGTYEWRLFANNGWSRLATSSEVTVTASPAVLTVNGVTPPAEASVGAGSQVTVTLTDGPGNPTDWIGLAPAGSPDTTLVDWRYLNRSTVPPSTGLTGGTVQFLAPAAAGAYEVRFFAHNSFNRLAMTTVGVVTSTAALTVNDTEAPTAVSDITLDGYAMTDFYVPGTHQPRFTALEGGDFFTSYADGTTDGPDPDHASVQLANAIYAGGGTFLGSAEGAIAMRTGGAAEIAHTAWPEPGGGQESPNSPALPSCAGANTIWGDIGSIGVYQVDPNVRRFQWEVFIEFPVVGILRVFEDWREVGSSRRRNNLSRPYFYGGVGGTTHGSRGYPKENLQPGSEYRVQARGSFDFIVHAEGQVSCRVP